MSEEPEVWFDVDLSPAAEGPAWEWPAEPEGSGEEDWEISATFAGPCTCPPECRNHDEPDSHSWGGCGAVLPDSRVCPCEAGWEE